MKKSLLALAVMGAFAGSAFAQASSVTIFGKLDQAVGKPLYTKEKQVIDNAGGPAGANSRIGFRGYEDLGGGLGAVFAFEHRFNVDTGVANATFWNGFSFVGLRHASAGTLTIGRHYTSSFLGLQNQIDPFAGETVAGLRDDAMMINQGIAKVRVANSLKYDVAMAGVALSASVAEAPAGSPDRPYALAASYGFGPFWAGLSYENPEGANDKLLSIGARFKAGPALLSAAYTTATQNTTNRDAKSYLLGANVTVGSGDIKLGFASFKLDGSQAGLAGTALAEKKKMSLGYHHNLSKRTKVYADFTRDSKATTPVGDVQKTGYDLGIQHNF